MKIHRNRINGSILLEAAIAVAILIVASAVSTQTIISGIIQNRWAAAQAIAEGAIDIEAARARRIFPSEIATDFPASPSVRTVTRSMGTIGSKVLNGTFKYTSLAAPIQLNTKRTRLIIVLEFTVDRKTYLKSREVARHESI